MHRVLGVVTAFWILSAAPLAAQTQTTASSARIGDVGGWAGDESADGSAPASGPGTAKPAKKGGIAMIGDSPFRFTFVPLGLIFLIARLTLAHYLRKSPKADEKVYEYHEPPVQKWKPLDPQAEARLRILEPDYVPESKPEPAPVPVTRPARSFGKRGL